MPRAMEPLSTRLASPERRCMSVSVVANEARLRLSTGQADFPAPSCALASRVRVDGKFFRVGSTDWHVKGFTYGPFRPNSEGFHVPDLGRVAGDFEKMRGLGANAVRLYHP